MLHQQISPVASRFPRLGFTLTKPDPIGLGNSLGYAKGNPPSFCTSSVICLCLSECDIQVKMVSLSSGSVFRIISPLRIE